MPKEMPRTCCAMSGSTPPLLPRSHPPVILWHPGLAQETLCDYSSWHSRQHVRYRERRHPDIVPLQWKGTRIPVKAPSSYPQRLSPRHHWPGIPGRNEFRLGWPYLLPSKERAREKLTLANQVLPSLVLVRTCQGTGVLVPDEPLDSREKVILMEGKMWGSAYAIYPSPSPKKTMWTYGIFSSRT